MSRYHTASTIESLIEPRMRHLLADFLAETPGIEGIESTRVLDAMAEQALTSNAGGKRFRALLSLATYRAFAPEHPRLGHRREPQKAGHAEASHATPDRATPDRDECMLDIACAIELYQTSALIHDDIIDESAMRRGKPSAHAALTTLMGDQRQGRALALMLGNMLATASAQIATSAFHRMTGTIDGSIAFSGMQHAVEIGQTLDLALERMPLNTADQAQAALQVYRWKTASYTTMAPIEFGAMGAGMSPRYASRIAHEIGLPLGVAFQLADDLLDVTGDSHNTGKPVGGDIKEGKRTVLLADAIAAADTRDRTRLMDIMAADQRDARDVAEVTRMYESSGAIAASRRRITTLVDSSRSALGALGLSSTAAATIDAACSRFIPDIED